MVILGCFDHEQDQVLQDGEAIKKAVTNTAAWIKERGYTNVALEIANEHINKAYDHDLIRDPLGMRDLIVLAKKVHPTLLVSASGAGRVPLPVVTQHQDPGGNRRIPLSSVLSVKMFWKVKYSRRASRSISRLNSGYARSDFCSEANRKSGP